MAINHDAFGNPIATSRKSINVAAKSAGPSTKQSSVSVQDHEGQVQDINFMKVARGLGKLSKGAKAAPGKIAGGVKAGVTGAAKAVKTGATKAAGAVKSGVKATGAGLHKGAMGAARGAGRAVGKVQASFGRAKATVAGKVTGAKKAVVGGVKAAKGAVKKEVGQSVHTAKVVARAGRIKGAGVRAEKIRAKAALKSNRATAKALSKSKFKAGPTSTGKRESAGGSFRKLQAAKASRNKLKF